MAAGLTALVTSDERELELRTAGRRTLRGDHRVWLVAASALVWLAGYAVALGTTNGSPTGRLVVQSMLYPVPIAVAAVLTAVAAGRAAGWDRVFWAAMAGFSGLWLAGEVVWAVEAAAGALPAWGGSLATAFYLLSYLPALVGAVSLCGRPTLRGGAQGLFDTAVVALAVAYVGYELTVRPALSSHGSTEVVLDAAYPVLDAIVLLLALSAGIGARRFVPLPRLLVTASLACSMIMDGAYSQLVNVRGSDGHWLDLGWQAEAVLIAVAAVVALRHREVEARIRTLPGRWGVGVVLAACLAVVGVAQFDLLSRGPASLNVAAIGAAVLALVARGWLATSQLRAAAVHLDHARAEQERLAVTDTLTGLYNRRFFEEFLRIEADRSLRHGSPLSLIVADLDRFKQVNDTHGHPAGDRVLLETARRLRGAVRDSDVVARYGGEEFVIVLPDADPDAALEVAERCRRVLEESPVRPGPDHPRGRPGDRGGVVVVTGSFGVATLWSVGAATVDDLVRAADRALYRAKGTGRNRVAPAGEWDFLPAHSPDQPTARRGPAEQTDPVLVSLLRAADLVDADQSPDEHATAIARWAAVIVDALGLDAATRDRVLLAGRLHDVGKLAIPRSVLTKPGRLTEQEWALMATHPEHSAALLALSPTTADLAPLVRAHHERVDGTGYPDHLVGTQIPIESRIIAVCDSWAAMRATRVYAPARPVQDCRRQLLDGRGTQFDPDITDAFLRLEHAELVGDLNSGAPTPEGVPDRLRN